LVALHGGSFAIASVPGEGTVITILIPLDGSAAVDGSGASDVENTVDFPPRLKNATELAEVRTRVGGMKDSIDDHAEAKIA
jgi:cell cycle sensor histidine kinase DivJ